MTAQTTFNILEELPSLERAGSGAGPERMTKSLIRACIAHPEKWIEAIRVPVRNPGGSVNTNLYTRSKRYREYGLQAEVRRLGDERVLYVRLLPGMPS